MEPRVVGSLVWLQYIASGIAENNINLWGGNSEHSDVIAAVSPASVFGLMMIST